MEMYAFVGRILLAFISLCGAVSALDCLKCDWSIQNSTVDDTCLGAPYKVESVECKGTLSGVLYMCQTKAVFSIQSGVKNLEILERTCGPKHADCNNACAENTEKCWQCCKDSSNCNGFPLRANVVVTSSANHVGILLKTFIVIFVLLRTI